MRRICGWLFILLVTITSAQAKQVEYIDAPPLARKISVPAGAVSSMGQIKVPIITWGGDIATIYANGNQISTAPDSIFARQGFKNLSLVLENDFTRQLEMYIKGEMPYLRGTLGMVNMAAEAANRDPRTKPVVIYQLTWSSGGDAIVVKDSVKSPKDLKGKTVAVQAYGPHVDYLAQILSDAGLKMNDVRIKWVRDITVTGNDINTPGNALLSDPQVDAAMVIIPDALALTSGGKTGTGAEGSVKGARILLTTKTANHVIADVYAVRSDYFESHRDEVGKFVHGLMLAEESLRELFAKGKSQSGKYQPMISAAANILMGSPQAVSDTEGMYHDCTYAGWEGNIKFFSDPNYPRRFDQLNSEIQKSFTAIGLMGGKAGLAQAKWDYNKLKSGLTAVQAEAERFDTAKVAKVIDRKQKQATLDKDKLFAFKVFFQPNQNSFAAEMYKNDFDRVINLASTYGGAVITIEGHSDPLGYLKQKKNSATQIVLTQTLQAAKNLSLTRANAVRDSLIEYAKSRSVKLDPAQFNAIGWGISKPANGMCGDNPCPPQNEREWLDNMRVEFSVINVEAEASEFELLN